MLQGVGSDHYIAMDTVLRGLWKQRYALCSKDADWGSGVPCYGSGNLRCAIGHLLPQRILDKKACASYRITSHYAKSEMDYINHAYPTVTENFFVSIQKAHDGSNSPEDMVSSFNDIVENTFDDEAKMRLKKFLAIRPKFSFLCWTSIKEAFMKKSCIRRCW